MCIDFICNYLFCGICLRRNREQKKLRKVTKRKNLNLLQDITPPSDKSRAHNLLKVKTKEMTDHYKIPNNKYRTDYDVLESIGYKLEGEFATGGFAAIHKAIHIKRNLTVVCKKITLPEVVDEKTTKKRLSLMIDIKNELNFLEKIIHPNLIKMIRHLVIETNNRMTFYILMQMAVGGDLSDKMKECGPFSEKTCKHWFAQILSGMSFMHSKGYAHRDLKLANLLLDETQDILISDFGLSRFVWRESEDQVLLSHTYCGTPPYMAPEILEIPIKKRHTFDYEYNAFLADIWSLGIVLYRLFNDRYPFDQNRSLKKIIKNMKRKKWDFSTKIKVKASEGLIDIVTLMLEPDPQQRITMKRLVVHKWIESSFKAVEEKNSKHKNIF